VAQQADVIITMLPDTPDVAKVLFGDDGVAHGCRRARLVIDMSSISPMATKDFAKRINELGCDYLDAPVSGGEVGAKNAALTIMVGGPRRRSSASSRCSRRWARTSRWSAATATARPARWPTRSSSR
jgi:2-hydroxy-3-oxopropionate reductase